MTTENQPREPSKQWNDKPEDGEFLLLSKALCEALITTDELTKTQMRIIHYIVRMTWGWGRPLFIFSQKAACDKTGIDKAELSRAYNALIKSDVLITQKGEVGINKYTDQWNLELLDELNCQKYRKKKELGKTQEVGKNPTEKTVGKNPTSWGFPNNQLGKTQLAPGQDGRVEPITAPPIESSIESITTTNPPTPHAKPKNGVDHLEGVYSEIRKRCPPFSPNDYEAMRQAIATGLPLDDIERIIRELATRKGDTIKTFRYFLPALEDEAKRREALSKPIPKKEVKPSEKQNASNIDGTPSPEDNSLRARLLRREEELRKMRENDQGIA